MEARSVARLQALGRLALGAGLAAAPGRSAPLWVGADGRSASAQVLAAGLGARDAALAIGLLRAVGQGHGARPWLRAGLLADAVDLAATLRARRALPPAAVVGVSLVAGGSVALGGWLLRSLEPRPLGQLS